MGPSVGCVVLNIQQHTLQRFWKSVNKLGPASDYTDDKCWVWTGTTNKSGYGKLSVNGKSVYSHRLSYYLATGELPTRCVISAVILGVVDLIISLERQ